MASVEMFYGCVFNVGVHGCCRLPCFRHWVTSLPSVKPRELCGLENVRRASVKIGVSRTRKKKNQFWVNFLEQKAGSDVRKGDPSLPPSPTPTIPQVAKNKKVILFTKTVRN